MVISNNNEKLELYKKIANDYIKLIKDGAYKNNEYIPSIRTIAVEYGINPNTVARAFSLLEELGYIVTVPKKGAYVSYDSVLPVKNTNNLDKKISEMKKQGYTKEDIITTINKIYGGKNDRD
ncbi:MAG: GntR family transcriptional regulator [Acholeplasmatales bacterium]|jgi:GntR family transcriptional regulator|nr:GntR family transcriptional regulator [Acholeplasmatales bacterium]